MTDEQWDRLSRWALYIQCGCGVVYLAFILWLILLH